MRKPLLVLLLILAGFTLKADTPLVQKPVVKPVTKPKVKTAPLVVQYDSAQLNTRYFNQRVIANYRTDKAFDYDDKHREKGLSLWDRFWAAVWRFIGNLFSQKEGRQQQDTQPSVIKLLLIAACVIGLIFVIIKVIGGDLVNIFRRDSKQIALPYTESLENIHEITFDEEIAKALSQRNYRLGVRLLYLSSLKQLNDARLISWQIEKTNATYLDELTNADQRQSFGVLTRQFEYIWYGDFPVDATSYQNINTLFMDFKKLLP